MEYRNLGDSGVKVSEVGLGTFYGWGRKISNVRASEWKLTADEMAEIRTILEGNRQ